MMKKSVRQIHFLHSAFRVHQSTIMNHSERSATIGSTLVARRAGIEVARKATAINTKATAAKVPRSVGWTPKSIFCKKRWEDTNHGKLSVVQFTVVGVLPAFLAKYAFRCPAH